MSRSELSRNLLPVAARLGNMVGTGTPGGSCFSVSRRVPPPPADFREALERFREVRAEVLAAELAGRSYDYSRRSALWRLRELSALLSLYPDPADAGKLLELTGPGGKLLPEQSAALLPLAERVAALCPAEPLGLSAEAEAVRVRCLELLGELERDAETGKIWAFYGRKVLKFAPGFRGQLEQLPRSAAPHADAARAAELAGRLTSGGFISEAWELTDTAEKLAELTAPEPPHGEQVAALPAFPCLLEPDPPLAWEARAEVRGVWYGFGSLTPERARKVAAGEGDPLSGVAYVSGGPDRGDAPELLPVRFPLALRRRDLRNWRGWVPAPEG